VITEVFIKRYPNPLLGTQGVPSQFLNLFAQAAHIIFEDLIPAFELEDGFFLVINKELAREIGAVSLTGRGTARECVAFLTIPYDVWNDAHGVPDTFVKLRLSFLELVFRHAEEQASAKRVEVFRTNHAANAYREGWIAVLRKMIDELNARFRDAAIPLHYHNGMIQFAEDPLAQAEIAGPFWESVRDPQWANVDRDMKEAIDRRDNNGRDPAGYAMRALESSIKIISDLKGWTTGNEKGASNFIDNLQSKRGGNFIAGWEADILRQMFKEVRNPLAHGDGSAAPLYLTPQQTNWVIESCMSWIKNLVLRM
jgi:hypothetical protein